MYCIDTEALVVMFNEGRHHHAHSFTIPLELLLYLDSSTVFLYTKFLMV